MRNLILPVMQGVTLVHHHYQVRLLLCFGAFCIHYGPGKAVGLLNGCSLVPRANGSLLCGHNGNEPCRTGSRQSLAGSQLQELPVKVLGILQVAADHLHH